ncbi:glycerophosphodiester phosphodiesterase [Nonomuraea longicatena]|uniref:Hydrolase n=1 Tax=Nonomuraea longicatena TaxID=83682 RepID=A0ABP3Z424_9ACTN
MFDADPVIIAHRGAPQLAPENTLAAVHAAYAAGADMYELDVHQTKDGHLVVLHDSSLARTTDAEDVYPGRAPWRVRDFTLAEIDRLDAGSWFGAEYAGERIPTLSSVFQAMKGDPGLLLEVKHPSRSPGIADRVSELMAQAPPTTIVHSFDWGFIKQLRYRGTRAVLGTPRPAELGEIATYAKYVSVKHRRLDTAYVRRAHRLGLKVFAYTVDTPAAMRRTLLAGVDGFITNRPRFLRQALDANPCFGSSPTLSTFLQTTRFLDGGSVCPPSAFSPAPRLPAAGGLLHSPTDPAPPPAQTPSPPGDPQQL